MLDLKTDKNNIKIIKEVPSYFVKRDGAKFSFALYKLKLVLNAMDLSGKIQENIISGILNKLIGKDEVSAQEVATAFVDTLKELGLDDKAQAYIEYRKQDEEKWEEQTNPTERLARLQGKDPSLVHENANKDSKVFNTQRDLTAGTVGKTLGLKMMPEHVAKAHLRGDIHYHDLDYTPWSPMTNCCLIDFKEMLTHGFKIGNAEVESPHSIQTATA